MLEKRDRAMTYRNICEQLAQAGIENAKWDAALLLERFCGADTTILNSDPDREYGSEALERAICDRQKRVPLQYILGEWSFYRQVYEVSPDCLIPRSDTEILVEEAVLKLPRQAHFADYCTGSGCIAVSVLAERPDTTAVALDKFPNTVALAEKNAVKNGVATRLKLQCADLFETTFLPADPPYDAILSNPPYITEAAMETLAPELQAEPWEALCGGKDGLLFYRHILQTQGQYLKPNGFLILEIGYDQADAVCALGSACGFGKYEVRNDYGGNARVVTLRRTDA